MLYPFLNKRIRVANAPMGNPGVPRRQPRAFINRVADTIAVFDAARVGAELGRLGMDNVRREHEHSFHATDTNGFAVQIKMGPM